MQHGRERIWRKLRRTCTPYLFHVNPGILEPDQKELPSNDPHGKGILLVWRLRIGWMTRLLVGFLMISWHFLGNECTGLSDAMVGDLFPSRVLLSISVVAPPCPSMDMPTSEERGIRKKRKAFSNSKYFHGLEIGPVWCRGRSWICQR